MRGSENTTSLVVPASMVIVRSADPALEATMTLCSTGREILDDQRRHAARTSVNADSRAR